MSLSEDLRKERDNMELQIGDKIRVKGCLGVDHYGIYVGPRAPHGEDVVHNDKNGGVRLISFSAFAEGQPCYIVSRVYNGRQAQEVVARRALSLIGKKYDLFNFNCEHFANYVQHGICVSPQLQGAALIVVSIAGLAMLKSLDNGRGR